MPGYSSYDTVGQKEDVSDVISNIAPTKTPFQTMIGSESADRTFFEWQEDDLRAAAANAQVEGFDAVAVARTPTSKRDNYTQIFSDTFQTTGTVDRVAHYGRAKESAYQAAKAMAALKRDVEYAMVGAITAKAAGTTSTARYFASYFKQLVATAGADSGQWIKTGGAATKVSEQNILDVSQALYTAGADPSTLMVTPINSVTVSDFAKTSGSLRERDMGTGTTLVNVIDVYVSPFGKLSVVINRFLKDKYTLIFNPEMWSKVTLRPWFRETLAKTGDNVKMMIVGEFSLKHKNFNASGLISEEA